VEKKESVSTFRTGKGKKKILARSAEWMRSPPSLWRRPSHCAHTRSTRVELRREEKNDLNPDPLNLLFFLSLSEYCAPFPISSSEWDSRISFRLSFHLSPSSPPPPPASAMCGLKRDDDGGRDRGSGEGRRDRYDDDGAFSLLSLLFVRTRQ